MIEKTDPHAQTRALFSAALAGAAVGLGLTAASLGGIHGPAAAPPAPARLAVRVQAPAATPPAVIPPAPAQVKAASSVALPRARDLDCLTRAVYYEARGESAKGQAAVAQVVLNRVRHPAFPKTVCAGVFQGAAKADCQFSFVCDGSMHRARDAAAWDRARLVAARALSGVVMVDIGAATSFHASRLGQQWGDGLVRVTQVGLHVFYRFGHPRPQPQSFAAAPAERGAEQVSTGDGAADAPAPVAAAQPAQPDTPAA